MAPTLTPLMAGLDLTMWTTASLRNHLDNCQRVLAYDDCLGFNRAELEGDREAMRRELARRSEW